METLEMKGPIFIIGCPRSGTSITLNIVARHEELAWVSDNLNGNPNQLKRAKINRIYDLPTIGDLLYLARTQGDHPIMLPYRIKNFLPAPVEPWVFWDSYLQNFQWRRGGIISPRRRTKDDITLSEVMHIRQAIEAICQYQNKRRFLSKYTDFPRITYLNEAFPDAIFIHIVRDGRAVAASCLEKIESGEFGTWNEREWWIKGWPESWRDEWVKKYKTPLSFVAFQWKFFVSEIWEDAKAIGKNRYMEIRYKDIVTNPHLTFNRLFEFCQLGKSRRVETYLDKINLSTMDYKWKDRFDNEEKEILARIVGDSNFTYLLDGDGA